MSKTLSVCVPLWEIFFNMAYNEFFGPTHTTHGHFFLENRHTQRSLEGGPCAGHMEPTLIFPSGSRRGRAKYDSTKKVERRGSGRRCEVCRMSPGQQSVDRSLPFLIGILKGKRGVSIAYFWGASRAAAAVDG